jgi:hypothetical protein
MNGFQSHNSLRRDKPRESEDGFGQRKELDERNWEREE